jgi:predicted DNA-binding protein with PD1-like motif
MSSYKLKRTLIGQLASGSDLYEEMTKIVQREDILIGRIQGIGAVTQAKIAYYDQNKSEYINLEFSDGMEIVSLTGNISMRDGKPFIHAHIVLSDREGKTFGGHLLPGTKLFACELFIEEFDGEKLIRTKDGKTGLFLWDSGPLT